MELREEEIWFLNRATANGCISNDYIHGNHPVSWYFDLDGFLNVTSWECNIAGHGYTKLPYKYGRVDGEFNCSGNPLTTMEGFPKSVRGRIILSNMKLTSLDFLNDRDEYFCKNLIITNNPLTDYFKNIKECDFKHWDKLYWEDVLREYPFLINIGKKYLDRDVLNYGLKNHPTLKLYLG